LISIESLIDDRIKNDNFIENEIKNSTARLEFEYSSFYMGLIVDLEVDLVKNL
jgi:hypothetical protein